MRRKVLLVDDDPDFVDLLLFNFRRAGFDIGTASNGIEALKQAKAIAPDLIVLDLMMPELDGFGVCEILRREKRTAMIPIIMVTALSGQMGRLTGLDAGATEYLTKPFSPRLLVETAGTILGRCR